MMDSDSSSGDENVISYRDFKLLAQRKRNLNAVSVADSDYCLNKKYKHNSKSHKLEDSLQKSVPNDLQRSLFFQCRKSNKNFIVSDDSKFRKQEQVEIIDLRADEPSRVKCGRRDINGSRKDLSLTHDKILPITGHYQTDSPSNANKVTSANHLAFLLQETLPNVTTKSFELAEESHPDKYIPNNYEIPQDIKNGKLSTGQLNCLNDCCAVKEQSQLFDQISRNNRRPFSTNSNSKNRTFESDSQFSSTFMRSGVSLTRTKLPVKLEQMEVVNLCSESMEEAVVAERQAVRPSLNLKNVTTSFELFVKSCFLESEDNSVDNTSILEIDMTDVPTSTGFVRDSCGEQVVGNVKQLKLSETKTAERVQLEAMEGIDLCTDSDKDSLLDVKAVKPCLKLSNVTKSFELLIKSAFESEDASKAPINVKLENTYNFDEIINDDPACALSNSGFDHREIRNKQSVQIEEHRKSPFSSSQKDVQVLITEDARNCTAEPECETNHFDFKQDAVIIEAPPFFAKLTQEVGTQTAVEVSTQTEDFYCTMSERSPLLTTVAKQNAPSARSPIICCLPKLDDILPTSQSFAESVFVAAHKNANLNTINERELYAMFIEQVDIPPQTDLDSEISLEENEPMIENLTEPFEEEPTEFVQIKNRHQTGRIKRDEVITLENILLNKEGQISIQEVGTVGWLQSALAVHRSLKEKAVGRVKNKRKEICCNFLDDALVKAKKSKSTTKVIHKKNKRPSSRSKKNSTQCSAFSNDSDNSAAVDDDRIVNAKLKSKVSALKKAMLQITKDISLQSGRINEARSVTRAEIKRRIEYIFEQLYAAFKSNMLPVFIVRARSLDNCMMEEGRLQIVPFENSRLIKILYNRPVPKFVVMVHILGRIYNLINNELEITKRELYYQIRHLIRNNTQAALNTWVAEVSCLLDAAPWELNISARSGLVYGDLKLVFTSNETLNCHLTGTSIPYDVDEIVEIHTNATFILIVEKESIFKQLIEEDLQNKVVLKWTKCLLQQPMSPPSGPLLTKIINDSPGKGFPTLTTQFFLKRLWELLSIPVFIIVDPDPHGIQIMFNYRFGSVASCHLSHHLAVPGVRWLGIFPSEIFKYKMASTPLTNKDKNLTARLIRSPCVQNNPQIVSELVTMLSKNRKASIEGLVKDGTFLSNGYLPGKFCSHSFL